MDGDNFSRFKALDTTGTAHQGAPRRLGTKVASPQGMVPRQASLVPTAGERDTQGLGVRPILLIVDDDDDVRALTSNLLCAGGYAVLEACEGADALNQLRGAAHPHP